MKLLIGLIAFVAWLAYVGGQLSKQREVNDKIYKQNKTQKYETRKFNP